MNHEKSIKNANTISDIFEIVKEIVREYLGLEQAGLMVGLTDLGMHDRGFIGAFYSLDANTIIINKKPLARLFRTNPSLYNFYLFHIILHEYIHSIGSLDEAQTRQLVYEISRHYFGEEHTITQLTTNMQKFMPNLTYPVAGFQPPTDINIDFVMGIDKKNINYIN
ncbi:hypothetical protein HYX02_05830 [Candidatus Woesearchaeota archaeon]|nr:hypothetical protein [Candidatus Woesearchaeota archaeon]